MLQKPIEEEVTPQKSYSYQDILKMKSETIYSSLGNTIISEKPTAPRATFGRAQRSSSGKKYTGKQFEKDLAGREGVGPAGYLPPRLTLPDGKVVIAKDPLSENKYPSAQSFSIGKYPRRMNEPQVYEYMKHENDEVEVDKADLKRKNSSPNILIGSARRFSQEKADKITPGPTYDPVNRLELKNAPKYSMTSRKTNKNNDALVVPSATTNLVGPNTYFQKVKKSNSTSSLSRVPYDSRIKKEPIISMGKGPRTLTQIKNSVDETYDIKHKTIASNYDFEYDGGKGHQSGKSFMKKNIINSCNNPLERNKMGSFSIGRTSKDKEVEKRGFFKSSMSQAPQSVRIQIPKF